MTIQQVYELYKGFIGTDKKIIICDAKNGDGWEILNVKDFDPVFARYTDEDLYIIDYQEGEDFTFFEFFRLEKIQHPKVILIRHNVLNNAYWKEAPDKILGSIQTSEDAGIARFLSLDYKNLLREYIIELPEVLPNTVENLLKSKFKETINATIIKDMCYSIVFSNTDRFDGDPENVAFDVFELNELYPDIKKPAMKTIATRLWNEIKLSVKIQNDG